MTRAPDGRGTLGPQWLADNLPRQDFDRGMLARRADDQHATWIDEPRRRMCWLCLAIWAVLIAVGLWGVWHAFGLLFTVAGDALHIYSLPRG
ncbi:hypothetical protein AN189_17470 [Loktanella sp. 3ANDIMAR09]|uniref:hypothetical protein n=1 Tax=Loktanella sp. 3ANDIMAR09 TaxID=1225657 RepID=UPI0006FD842B|nr:hypothetical protein [Loktanella sp. 3ANDIMAR09]KQI67015.1 hypothetical protein AN189_17470 [Loktanella sp. 3ANDIMAR09]